MIPGPPGQPGKDGKDGEDGKGGDSVLLIDAKLNEGVFSQVLDFTSSVKGKTSGTLPRNISRVVLRVLGEVKNLPLYGVTETGEKVGGYGTVALIVDDVIIHQYSLNRFSDVQLTVPQGRGQTVEVFVSPLVACRVAVLDEGHRWVAVRLTDPENLPEMTASQIN